MNAEWWNGPDYRDVFDPADEPCGECPHCGALDKEPHTDDCPLFVPWERDPDPDQQGRLVEEHEKVTR